MSAAANAFCVNHPGVEATGACEDCKQRHTRVYNKLSWIRQAAGAILGRTVTCTTGTAGGLDYDKCF